MTDLEKARKLLRAGGYTCVLCRGDEDHTSAERGVKPLVEWLESNTALRGFSAADKVVGKGAAFLYVLLGVQAVYSHVISITALEVLRKHGITVEYDSLVEHIINRRGDGFCPFEMAVTDIDDADTAYRAIRKKMDDMNIAKS